MTYLSRKAAQARLSQVGINISESGIKKWMARGTIPATKFGNRWAIPAEAVDAFIENMNADAERALAR